MCTLQHCVYFKEIYNLFSSHSFQFTNHFLKNYLSFVLQQRRCEICSKLTIMAPEQCQSTLFWHNHNFEHIFDYWTCIITDFDHEQIIKQEEDNLNEIEMNWNFNSEIYMNSYRSEDQMGFSYKVLIDRYRKSHSSHVIPRKEFNRKHITSFYFVPPLRISYRPSYYLATCQVTLYYIMCINHVCTQMT